MKQNPLLNPSGKRVVATASAIAVAVAAYGGYTAWVISSSNKPQQTELAAQNAEKKKDDVAAIGALGRLEPAGEVHKLSPPAGGFSSRIQKVLVKEGDVIKPGQPLAVMDTYESQLAIARQAEAEMIAAKTQLENIQSGAKSGDINAQAASQLQAEAEVRRTAVDLDTAELELQKVKSAGIKLSAEVEKAKWDYEKYKQLKEGGAVSEQEKLSRELTLISKQQELEQGKQTIAQAERNIGQRKQSLDAAQARVAAEASRLSSVREVRPGDIKQAEAAILVAQAAFERAKSDLERAIVKSPIPGKVLKINAKEGESVGNTGIMDLGFTDKMYVVAEVDENSISKISKGNRAIVKSDAFQGELVGKVESIGAQVRKNSVTSADPADKQDIRVVEVKILLEDSKPVQGLTNLQVKVAIQP